MFCFSVAVVFQICIQNRYKLNKKYRKWLALSQTDGGSDLTIRAMLSQAKVREAVSCVCVCGWVGACVRACVRVCERERESVCVCVCV